MSPTNLEALTGSIDAMFFLWRCSFLKMLTSMHKVYVPHLCILARCQKSNLCGKGLCDQREEKYFSGLNMSRV